MKLLSEYVPSLEDCEQEQSNCQSEEAQVKTFIFKCDNCEYQTKKRSNLLRHIKSQHESYSIQCDTCDFSTVHLSYMKRHKKLHEKPQTLPDSSESSQSSTLKKKQTSFFRFCEEMRNKVKMDLSRDRRHPSSRNH